MRTIPRRLTVPIALVVVAVALTACSMSTPIPTANSSSPSVAPTPSPTPSTTPAPVAVALPAQVFSGDCAQLGSGAAFSAALGATVASQTLSDSSPSQLALSVLGGLACQWSGSKQASISLAIANTTSGLTVGDPQVYCYGASTKKPGSSGSCSVSAVSGDYWLTGVIYSGDGTTNAQTKKAVAAIRARFVAAATAAGPPAAVSVPDGTWTAPAACTALARNASIRTALDSPKLHAQDADTSGAELPAAFYAALGKLGVYSCAFDSVKKIGSFTVYVVPGGGGLADTVAALPGAKEVTVDGLSRVIEMSVPDHATADVFDGANWVRISVNDRPADLEPLLPAIVAALTAAG